MNFITSCAESTNLMPTTERMNRILRCSHWRKGPRGRKLQRDRPHDKHLMLITYVLKSFILYEIQMTIRAALGETQYFSIIYYTLNKTAKSDSCPRSLFLRERVGSRYPMKARFFIDDENRLAEAS